MAWACGFFKSSATERLLRACTCHQTEVPSFSKRHLRSGSPAPGASILMMSAPKSASVLAANGPAISWPSSSTFNPVSGLIAAVNGALDFSVNVIAGSVPTSALAVYCIRDPGRP